MGVFQVFKKRPDIRVVIDVGSHNTKALIFEMRRGGAAGSLRPKIIKKLVLRLSLLYKEDRVVAKLREFMFIVVRKLERVPEKMVVAFGPTPMGASLESWSMSIPLPDRGKLTVQKLAAYFQGLHTQHESVMAFPTGLFMNGYPVRWKTPPCAYFKNREMASDNSSTVTRTLAPKQLKQSASMVREIGFSAFAIRPSKAILGAFEHMQQSLGGMPMEFIPLVVAHAEAITSIFSVPDALLIDVGGEETTLVAVREGTLVHSVSFPLGARHFLRGMSRAASLTFDEAEDLKRQYAQGHISPSQETRLHEFLSKESELWKSSFCEALESFYHIGPLPAAVFLFGGGAHIPEIKSVVQGPGWIGNFSHNTAPAVQVLDAPRFFEGDSFDGFLQGPEEVGLASLMIYAMCHRSLI